MSSLNPIGQLKQNWHKQNVRRSITIGTVRKDLFVYFTVVCCSHNLLPQLLQIAQQLCGINIMMYYSVVILQLAGIGSNKQSVRRGCTVRTTNTDPVFRFYLLFQYLEPTFCLLWLVRHARAVSTAY